MSMKRLFIVIAIILTSCNENLYLGKSNMNSNAALYVDAKASMSAQDWDTALTKFSLMDTGFRSDRAVAFDYAAALAGKCGFDMVTFSTALSAASLGANSADPTTMPLFYFLMQAYQQQTINMNVTGVTTPSAVTDTYCSWSQSIMDNIKSSYGSWTANEKFFVVMFNLARIGMTLRKLADADGAGNNGDGTMDNTFDACDSTTDMIDFHANHLVTAFANVVQNYSGLVSGANGAALDGFATLCTTTNLTLCTHTAIADVTANDRKNIRSMVMLSEDGTFGLDGIGAQNDVTGGNAADPAVGTKWNCSGLNTTGPAPLPPPNVELLINCCP